MGDVQPSSKRIWLSLELPKTPVIRVEYIIVHELIHLLERSHNERFLVFMNRFLPQWKTYKEELNRLAVRLVDWEY